MVELHASKAIKVGGVGDSLAIYVIESAQNIMFLSLAKMKMASIASAKFAVI